MKKFSYLVAAALLALAPVAIADGTAMILSTSNVPTGSIKCGGTDTTGATLLDADEDTTKAYPVMNAGDLNVQIFSDAGSTATVKVEVSMCASGCPWLDATATATVTNPSATGEWIIVPMVDYIRVRIDTYTSGNIRACLAARVGPAKVW